ncbi:MAG: GNAT family N-acetyltransferase [bacterium]
MEILKAKPEHASEIALLNDAVQKMHAEHHPEVFKYPTDAMEMERFFRAKISDNDCFIFLARSSRRAVGYVWGNIQRRQENVFKYGEERIYIHQLTVKPEYRRKGVGCKLMHAVECEAKENGISKLVLDSWEFNKEAHAFFEQLGFSCFNVKMWCEITKD